MRVVFEDESGHCVRINATLVSLDHRPEGDLCHIRLTDYQRQRVEKTLNMEDICTLDHNVCWAFDDYNMTHTWR